MQELQQSGAAAALELCGFAVPAVQGAVRLSCAQTGCGALEAGQGFDGTLGVLQELLGCLGTCWVSLTALGVTQTRPSWESGILCCLCGTPSMAQ